MSRPLSRAEERRYRAIRDALEAAEIREVAERFPAKCYFEDGMVLHFGPKRPWMEMPDGRAAHLHPVPNARDHRRLVFVRMTTTKGEIDGN